MGLHTIVVFLLTYLLHFPPHIHRMTETASRQMKVSGDGVPTPPVIEGIEFVNYVDEGQLDDVMRLVGQDLSEPYSSEIE